jgi:hypothetical protein
MHLIHAKYGKHQLLLSFLVVDQFVQNCRFHFSHHHHLKHMRFQNDWCVGLIPIAFAFFTIYHVSSIQTLPFMWKNTQIPLWCVKSSNLGMDSYSKDQYIFLTRFGANCSTCDIFTTRCFSFFFNYCLFFSSKSNL